MKRFFSWQIISIIVITLLLTFFDAPNTIQQKIFPWTPEFINKAKIHLGLDMQGGSQLDYKIDLRKVPEKEREGIISGVMEVIEKRVNGLGVAEPNIYQSKVGDEEHIIVELAEIKDLEKAKETVGKTIQLEFKEQKGEPDPNEEKIQKEYAQNILKKIREKKGENFKVIAQEETQANPGKIRYDEGLEEFVGKLDTKLQELAKKLKPGEVAENLVETENEYIIGEDEQLQQVKGIYIVKLEDKKEVVRFDKQVEVSHILIAYKGAQNAGAETTRTEEEAKKLAEDLLAKAKKGEDFGKLAEENTNDPGTKATKGVLGAVNKDSSYVPSFKKASLELGKEGDLTAPVKSEFGYHVIRANKIEKDIKEEKVKLEKIFVSTMPDPWKETGLTGEHFVHADVQFDQQLFQPYVAIKFNPEGAKLFEEITGRNVNKPLAIFVGGNLISAPNVESKIAGGSATITGRFTVEYATKLARDLNTGAIPAPIVLVGQHTIGSTLGQDALQKSLRAGLIGILLVVIFMIGYYRLPGLIASIALGIYSVLLVFMVKSELPLAVSLLIGTAIFLIILYKILNSTDNKGEKFLSFLLSLVILFFVSSVLSSPITLTLAGIAGVILSIGMAVDANILIFERTKEEIQNGHNIASAVEKGFDRAWSSIRDSNFSSLITCAILFYFGSSLIRGFALNLAIGIVISMFTAITITRTLMRTVVKTKLGEKAGLFVPPQKGEKKTYRIIENTKLWFGFSGTLIAISLIALATFGMKFGMDFTGGTFMEIKAETAESDMSVEKLKNELAIIEEGLKDGTGRVAVEEAASTKAEIKSSAISAIKESTVADTTSESPTLKSGSEEILDLRSVQVIETGEGSFQIKTKFISTETHDEIIKKLEEKFGKLSETRFETIGPTIGASMKKKALVALVIASLMIMIYLAFAFRKIPKHVNPWRFGVCAIVALIHDLFITFGFFLILGKFAGVEIDALFITALLTILGFSVHDTIVVFDRIRERLRSYEDKPLTEIANISLTETMSRSINTSFSTLLTLIALLLFGADSIFYFTLALTIGIIIGTYSSIFIASPLLVMWTTSKRSGEGNKLQR